jgi:hypothetical protein
MSPMKSFLLFSFSDTKNERPAWTSSAWTSCHHLAKT